MKKIYVNEQVCMGCRLCEVYCRAEHSQSKDLVKALKKESPQVLPRVCVEVRSPDSFAVQCRHCADAPCVSACLTGALHKDVETGIVSVDAEKCIGCWTCILACPFGAIICDTKRGKIVKCDLCKGKDIPVCVANCPNEAMVYAEAK